MAGVTQDNAHPHLSNDGKVAIVHNGILQNSDTLRKRLVKLGVKLNSETDSEIFCHYIAMELDRGKEPLEALQNVLALARGTWGLCVLFEDYDFVLCARNGSPLIIGRGKNEMFISSDPHAIREHTDQLVALEDGQIAKLKLPRFPSDANRWKKGLNRISSIWRKIGVRVNSAITLTLC